MSLTLIGKRCLILPDAPSNTTKGGIYLPDTVKQKRNTGTIVLIGDEVDKKFDKRKVLYNRLVDVELQYEGLEVSMIFSHDIIAILD